MLFEIINPSDPYTMEASSLDAAVVAIVLLGQGHIALKSLDEGENVPLFFLGGGDEWCEEHFSENFMDMVNRVMDTKLSEVADSLDSVLYGDQQDRVDFLAKTEGMDRNTFEAARMVRQDQKRSSINDIGERAYRMAAKLRETLKKEDNNAKVTEI